MFKVMLPLLGPEDVPTGGGGTSDNVAGSASGTSSGVATTGNVTSGTASDAMIKAAMAASSAETPVAGAQADTAAPITNGIVGDTKPPVAATGETNQPATGAPVAGQAPEPRIVAAVKNARAEVERQYAWAKGLNPEHVKVDIEVSGELRANPEAFAHQLAKELGYTLVKAGAAAAPTAETPSDVKLPQGRLQAEDGTRAYAADQMPDIIKAITAQVMSQLNPRLQPMEQDRQQAETRRQEETRFRNRSAQLNSALNEARKLPHFTKENEPAILAMMKAIPQQERIAMGPIAAIHVAYNKFMAETVLPSIDTAAEERVRANWTKKAATSTGSGHPTANGGAPKPKQIRDGDVQGLAARMAEMAASSS